MDAKKLYEAHGVDFTGETDSEWIGYCPFTNRSDKFYVNKTHGLWDSKTFGRGGNPAKFLELRADDYHKAISKHQLQKLADDRKLPIEAFKPWAVGWTGTHFSIPVRDAGGTMTDIRLYQIGGRSMATAGAKVGLLGAEHLTRIPRENVFLCEGEWDTIALAWLIKAIGDKSVVVGVPGSGTFKPEWAAWFTGRKVFTLYDNDAAGEAGEVLIQKRLQSVTQKLFFTHWPASYPTGGDVRDWVTEGLAKPYAPSKIYFSLSQLFKEVPRDSLKSQTSAPKPSPGNGAPVNTVAIKTAKHKTKWKHPSLDDVHQVFKKWLWLDKTDAIDIMLAGYVSQYIDGPPIWLFLVGPPGSAKTETLNALSLAPNVYLTSALTTHSLISGANWKDNVDPSLIPRLDGQVMIIKDFTAILSMRDTEKDEIFGILRDAYDGKCGKVFGNGIERIYESRFTILAAVTPSIYALSSQHQALGERFLKFSVGDNLEHMNETHIIRRAIENINQVTQMQAEIADVTYAYVTQTVRTNRVPVISDTLTRRIIYLSMFGARMRGTVNRDTYRNEIITSRPSAEVGSRLGIQLAKLCKSLAIVRGSGRVDDEDFRLARKVMLDTIPQRTEDILRHLLKATPKESDYITNQELSSASKYPPATVQRLIEDLRVLDVVRRQGTNFKYRWTVSPYIRECINAAGLYQSNEELARPTRMFIRTKKKTKRERPTSSEEVVG